MTGTKDDRGRSFADRLAQERRIKSVREWRDVTKEEIAAAVSTSAASYGRWEGGLNMPSDATIAKVADYFGVTRAWLRYGQEPRLQTPEETQGPDAPDAPIVRENPANSLPQREVHEVDADTYLRQREQKTRAAAKRKKPPRAG